MSLSIGRLRDYDATDGEESASLLWESTGDALGGKNEVHNYVVRQGSSHNDEDEENEGTRSSHGAALAAAAHRIGKLKAGTAPPLARGSGPISSRSRGSGESNGTQNNSNIGLVYGGQGSTYQILRGGVFFEAYGEDDVAGSNYFELQENEEDDCDEVHFGSGEDNNASGAAGKYQC